MGFGGFAAGAANRDNLSGYEITDPGWADSGHMFPRCNMPHVGCTALTGETANGGQGASTLLVRCAPNVCARTTVERVKGTAWPQRLR